MARAICRSGPPGTSLDADETRGNLNRAKNDRDFKWPGMYVYIYTYIINMYNSKSTYVYAYTYIYIDIVYVILCNIM